MSEEGNRITAVRSHPILELTRIRILEFFREPEALFWTFGFPVLLALALGVAFRDRPPDPVPTAVTGDAPSVAWLQRALSGKPFRILPLGKDEADRALRTGKADVLLTLRPGSGPERPNVVYRFDPTRPEARLARVLVEDSVQRAMGRKDPVPSGEEHETRPGARYIDFLLPGLIGMNLMGSGMWGVGFAVVQARVKKLLKRFAATPMRRPHYLLSFLLSRLALLTVEMVVLVGFGWLLFGVRVHGSLLDLAVVALVTSLAFLAIGLFTSARPRTVEAVSGWMNLIMLPMWVFSGSFFSYSRFPESFHPAIRLLPLTAANDALRLVMLEGASLWVIRQELLILGAWGILGFVLAVKLFRWQ